MNMYMHMCIHASQEAFTYIHIPANKDVRLKDKEHGLGGMPGMQRT